MLIVRELERQRSISLFKDQEDKLRKLNSKLALSIIRTGVDLALKEYEKKYGNIEEGVE